MRWRLFFIARCDSNNGFAYALFIRRNTHSYLRLTEKIGHGRDSSFAPEFPSHIELLANQAFINKITPRFYAFMSRSECFTPSINTNSRDAFRARISLMQPLHFTLRAPDVYLLLVIVSLIARPSLHMFAE